MMGEQLDGAGQQDGSASSLNIECFGFILSNVAAQELFVARWEANTGARRGSARDGAEEGAGGCCASPSHRLSSSSSLGRGGFTRAALLTGQRCSSECRGGFNLSP